MESQAFLNARVEGELAAARELIRLGIDQTQTVDVFDIIIDEQLWLIFQPLKDVLGTYITGGMLINSERTLPLQRLTAAHEYGHHVLRHDAIVDDVSNVTGSPQAGNDMREVSAKSFAMDFLMPLKLVNTLWKRLNLPKQVEDTHVYLLSLHLGASYEATVYQLVAQKRITSADAQKLLVSKPKGLKKRVGFGEGPRNSWADVWPLERKDSEAFIRMGIDDEVCIELPESPSTGYLWQTNQAELPLLPEISNEAAGTTDSHAILGLVLSEFRTGNDNDELKSMGEIGNRRIRLRALTPGNAEVRLPLIRSWSRRRDSADEFVLTVQVEERARGLLRKQQCALIAA